MASHVSAMPTAPAALDTTFAGFPPETFKFFRDLARHNDREWFQPRKEQFERVCLTPFKALTVALDPPLGAAKISRIYRDIRFSKDKSPYHTHLSAIVRGTYLWLSAKGLYVGNGIYMPESATLRKLREAIDADASGRALADLLRSLRKKGYEVVTHETVTSTPRGYDPDHPRIDLLKMKDIHAGKTLEPAALATAKAADTIRRISADIAPLADWLKRHVG
jgi:uncharacterized protein (TIGR02453 family)